MKPFSIMLLVGALFLAIAVLTSHWLSFGPGHAGLFSSGYCNESGDCETEYMIKYIGKGDARMSISILIGILTLLGGLGAVVLSGITGMITMGGKRGPSLVAVIFTGVTLFFGLVYLGLVHATSPSAWGFSLFLFFIGGGLVIGGAVMAMSAFPSARRPMMMMGMPGMPGVPPMGYMPQPGYGAGQMQPPAQGYGYAQPPQMQGYAQPQPPQMQAQAPQQPSCDQCGGATVWNGNVGKLFCGRCNRFLV